MAKISYKDSSIDTTKTYRKYLQASDRFVFSAVRVRKLIFTKKRIKGLTQKSLLPQAKIEWNNLSSSIKSAWGIDYIDFFNNGYKAFVKAYIQLHQNGGSGVPSPNTFYLGKVGKIEIQSPANRLHIQQNHPNFYYVMKKVPKTKSQYNPVRVTEFATFPINFKLSYKSNLVSLNTNYHARVYIRVYTNYQGRIIETDFIENLDLIKDWSKIIMNIQKPLGEFKGYDVHIDLYNVRGVVYFDNQVLSHNGKNWARDPNFDNMKTSYTRKYYQIERYWDIVDLPNGANYNSVYYEN